MTGATADGLSGTIEYMAPELIRGGVATPTSDLYALGCVLYEVLTGDVPFVGETPTDVLQAHLSAVPGTVVTVQVASRHPR